MNPFPEVRRALSPLLTPAHLDAHRAILLRIGRPAIQTAALVTPDGVLVGRSGAAQDDPDWRQALEAARAALLPLPPLHLLATPGGIAWAPQAPGTDPAGVLGDPSTWPPPPLPWETAADLPALLPRPGDWGLLALGGLDSATLSAHERLARRLLPGVPWPRHRQEGVAIRARHVPGGILVEQIDGRAVPVLLWAVPAP